MLHHVDDRRRLLPDAIAEGRSGKRVWDLHPGDALSRRAVPDGRSAAGGTRATAILGIETDGYGRAGPNYYFRHGGLLAPAECGILRHSAEWQPGSAIPANRAFSTSATCPDEIHGGAGLAVASVQVIEDIARLDEWYSGAGSRARQSRGPAIGLALKRMPRGFGAPPPIVDDMAGMADDMGSDRWSKASFKRERNCRAIMEFAAQRRHDDGVGPRLGGPEHPVAGSDRAGSADAIAMLERRVCANAARFSPATLLGDYKGVSFSGGQLAHVMQEQAGDRRNRQMMLGEPVLCADLQATG